MKNSFLNLWKNTYTLSIKGKNIERFLHRIKDHNIELLNIERKKYNELRITIYKKDYDEILKIKTIYEVTLVDIHGIIKIKKIIKFHKILLFFLILQILFLMILTNIIFEIEVVHTDKEIRMLIQKELEKYGIKEKKMKKSFQELQKIKAKILEENRDQLEWLEIENIGTKYIIRVEEREKVKKEKKEEIQNIVARKAGIIKKIEAETGEIIKTKNSYVNKGDTIITGSLYLNESLKESVSAKGKVYAETWYKVTITYPLHYYEKKYFEQRKTVYSLKFLNQTWELFNFKPWKQKESKEKILLKNNVLPISLVKQKQQKIQIIDKNYTKKEALAFARKLAYQKMEEQLEGEEKIISQKDLKVIEKNSTIELESFFTVYEDITAYQRIEGEKNAEGNPS